MIPEAAIFTLDQPLSQRGQKLDTPRIEYHEFFIGPPHLEGSIAAIVTSLMHGKENTQTSMPSDHPNQTLVVFRDLEESSQPDITVTGLPGGFYQLTYSPRVFWNGYTPQTLERKIIMSLIK